MFQHLHRADGDAGTGADQAGHRPVEGGAAGSRERLGIAVLATTGITNQPNLFRQGLN